jgi:serine/threonine-protein kinase
MGFLDLETGEVNDALLASRFNERAIALSPDGRRLAYVSDVTGRDEVFVRPFPDTGSGQRQVSRNGGIEPVWAHNGTELFYREGPSGSMMVATYTALPTFEVTNREALFDASAYHAGEGLSWHSYDVANDDRRFVMIRGVQGDEGDPGRLIVVRNWFTELGERLD